MSEKSITIGSPASRVLRSGLSRSKIGAEGEAWTALDIHRRFADDHPEVVVAHSLSIPGSTADIDHLVVIGDHMTVIDSKVWSSKRRWGLVDGDNGPPLAVSVDKDNGDTSSLGYFPVTVEWQADQIRAMFPEHTVDGVLCVHGLDDSLKFPMVENYIDPRSPGYVPVLSLHYLVVRLRYIWNRQKPQAVDAEVVDRLRLLTE